MQSLGKAVGRLAWMSAAYFERITSAGDARFRIEAQFQRTQSIAPRPTPSIKIYSIASPRR